MPLPSLLLAHFSHRVFRTTGTTSVERNMSEEASELRVEKKIGKIAETEAFRFFNGLAK